MNQVTEESFEKGPVALINKEPATGLEQYLALIDELHDRWEPEELWFRGVANSEHPLLPGIYRDDAYRDWEYDQVQANDLHDMFVLKARSYFRQVTQDYSDWEWYHLMQHYGLPTRLLDWTEGSLMGLYFASRNLEAASPAVWIIDPFWLNSRSVGSNVVFFSDVGRQSSGDEIANLYTRDTGDLPEMPIAIIPPYVDERLRVQRSRFTVHGSEKDGFNKLYQRHQSPRIACVRLEPASTETIKDEVVATGISESTLFPDLEGLARELKYEYGLFSIPEEDASTSDDTSPNDLPE